MKVSSRTRKLLHEPVEFQLSYGPAWLWIGSVVFASFMICGVYRSLVTSHNLPQVLIDYNNDLNRLAESGGESAALDQMRTAAFIEFDSDSAERRLLSMLGSTAESSPEAVSGLAKLVLRNPDDTELRGQFVSLLLSQGRVAEALDHCEIVLKQNPNDARAYCNLGAALLGQNRKSEAAAAFRSALEIDPSLEAARLALEFPLRDF